MKLERKKTTNFCLGSRLNKNTGEISTTFALCTEYNFIGIYSSLTIQKKKKIMLKVWRNKEAVTMSDNHKIMFLYNDWSSVSSICPRLLH